MGAEALALCTTVYPGVEGYLGAWRESVEAQTDQAFDLCIATDGLAPADAERAAGRPLRARWIPGPPGAGPSGVRSHAIGQLATAYAAVVFVDSDDLLEPTRVAAARAALRAADVAGCALRFVDERGRDLHQTFGPAPGADPAELLPSRNVFGLSNTAFRAATLRRCLPIPATTSLPDWYLATRAWATGATLAFDPVPRMAYRQHPRNIAGVLPPFTPAGVIAGTERVRRHYAAVLRDGEGLLPERRDAITTARDRVERFHSAVAFDAGRLRRYTDAVNRLQPERVWWWYVAHPALEDLWNT